MEPTPRAGVIVTARGAAHRERLALKSMSMSLNPFTLGVAVSVGWVFIVASVVLGDLAVAQAMKPNEWGDFVAGFFAPAPLAFLWLVLGYLQQGDELQLSTKALQLQAEELKNSVEQQRELVEVTRQQLEGERESFRLERLARQEAAKPLFVIRNNGRSSSGTTHIYRKYYYTSVPDAGVKIHQTELKLKSGGPLVSSWRVILLV